MADNDYKKPDNQWSITYKFGGDEHTSIVRGADTTVELPHNSSEPVAIVFDHSGKVKQCFDKVVSVDELDN
jgi:hypothetical protein